MTRITVIITTTADATKRTLTTARPIQVVATGTIMIMVCSDAHTGVMTVPTRIPALTMPCANMDVIPTTTIVTASAMKETSATASPIRKSATNMTVGMAN